MSDTDARPEPFPGPGPDVDRLESLYERWHSPPPEWISKLPKGKEDRSKRRHCETCGGYHDPSMFHLDYLGHADTTRALLEADPLWTWRPVAVDDQGRPVLERDSNGNPVGLWIELTVAGMTRLGYGTCSAGKSEAVKELIGDAIRNAAMRFGVALDLWSKADKAADEIGDNGEDNAAAAPPVTDDDHASLLERVETLLDTTEAAGLEVDADAARAHARHSQGHAEAVVRRLTERLEEADPATAPEHLEAPERDEAAVRAQAAEVLADAGETDLDDVQAEAVAGTDPDVIQRVAAWYTTDGGQNAVDVAQRVRKLSEELADNPPDDRKAEIRLELRAIRILEDNREDGSRKTVDSTWDRVVPPSVTGDPEEDTESEGDRERAESDADGRDPEGDTGTPPEGSTDEDDDEGPASGEDLPDGLPEELEARTITGRNERIDAWRRITAYRDEIAADADEGTSGNAAELLDDLQRRIDDVDGEWHVRAVSELRELEAKALALRNEVVPF